MKKILAMVAMGLVVGLLGAPVRGARISELTRLAGDQPNELVGVGLVFGLAGTGDGGDFMPAMRPLEQMLGHFGDPVTIAKELKSAGNVAIVMLSVSVPEAGAHEGDKLEVKVSAIAAKSLRGGHLFLCPMQGPHPNSGIYALASGDISIDDSSVPTQGTIRVGRKSGAALTEDIVMDNFSDGKFTLALLPTAASFAMATAIADQINEDVSPQTGGKPAAEAVDETTVVVRIPKAELARPAQFIARVQQLPVPTLPQAARVVINSKKKTIVFTGDVELSPTLICTSGMTITITPPNESANPPGTQVPFLALDPNKQGGVKLKELLDSLNLLKTGPEECITVIKELHEAGALRCQLDIN